VAVSVSNKVLSLRSAFSYSAIESIGSRIFDFATLWIVLNHLNSDDLAQFGLATSSIFFFNLFFLSPETGLLRNQKAWTEKNRISCYISSFIKFSSFKITFHYIAAICVYLYAGEMNWFFYSIVFSAATQQIQAAEIARIYMRMSLKQNSVAHFELSSKLFLCLLCFILLFSPSIEIYFSIYLLWSLVIALLWLLKLSKCVAINNVPINTVYHCVKDSLLGFSIWAHITGVITYFLYNANILFLNYFSYTNDDIAMYTVVTKVSNLFFVIPMFFQSFVPVLLSNENADGKFTFRKVMLICISISLFQLCFYVMFGDHLGNIFGVSQENIDTFYNLGLWINLGIFFLNITRPLATYLIIKRPPFHLLLFVNIPTVISAIIIYPLFIHIYGLNGAAYGSLLIFTLMSLLICYRYKVK
jgi:O-antigen/teichoic acid export membrane protein